MKTLEQDQRVMTLAEASSFLRVSERNLWQRARNGEVPSFRLGVQYRFVTAELLEWAANQESQV